MRRTILWHAVTGLVLSGLVTLSSGCRKELCYNHDEHAYSVKVDVTATWEREWERDHGRGWKNTWEGRGWNNWMTYDDLRPEVPGGIRAVVYDPDGNRHDERNLAAEGGRLGHDRRQTLHPVLQQQYGIHRVQRPDFFGHGNRHHAHPYPSRIQRTAQGRTHCRAARYALRQLPRGIRGEARLRGGEPARGTAPAGLHLRGTL